MPMHERTHASLISEIDVKMLPRIESETLASIRSREAENARRAAIHFERARGRDEALRAIGGSACRGGLGRKGTGRECGTEKVPAGEKRAHDDNRPLSSNRDRC